MVMKPMDFPPDGSGSGKEPGASRHRRGDAGFDRWLKAKLHHTYDSVLEEEVPADLMQLLQAFDKAPCKAAGGQDRQDDGEGGDRGRMNGPSTKGEPSGE
jgi:hypothetical protein